MGTPLLHLHVDKQISSGYRLAEFQYSLPMLPQTMSLHACSSACSQFPEVTGEESKFPLIDKDNAQLAKLIELAGDLQASAKECWQPRLAYFVFIVKDKVVDVQA